jgi:hypothetical protein
MIEFKYRLASIAQENDDMHTTSTERTYFYSITYKVALSRTCFFQFPDSAIR